MLTKDSNDYLLAEVAKACNFCFKPWIYSVIDNSAAENFFHEAKIIDLTLISKCRSSDGKRLPENDLEIEIYRSGLDLSITLSWIYFPNKPILWHGKHSLWMDSTSGSRVNTPNEAYKLEALARRIRSIFFLDE